MGAVDQTTKDYLREPDVFADAFNYLIYDGGERIRPEHLTPQSTVTLVKNEGKEKIHYVERTRDLLRNVVIQNDEEHTYLILGIESQSYVDYGMPVRNLLMNAMEYSEQMAQIKTMHRIQQDKLNSDEFLSGMRKDDKLKPVITLVILFSEKRWDGARKLSDMLGEMDTYTRRHFQDFELDLIEPAAMEDEEFDKFESSLRDVLKFMKYAGDREKMEELLQESKSYQRLEKKAAQVINTCAKLNLTLTQEQEDVDMCQAWEEQKNIGIQEGLEQGIEQTIHNMIQKMYHENIPLEQIATIAGMTVEQVKEILKYRKIHR